ncbi:LysR family transcriptional regulator [Burkholderia sp. Bp9126]|nr:LysR family transcriptional regulator [Burkholderia sp. Bp9126]
MLYFEIVMTERSFRKAADRLQVAPSEVSRQIQRLESETGLHLFDRHSSGVVPTEQAECLLRYHRGCEATYEVLQSELDALRSLKTGRVSISASEGVIPALAEEILWAFGNEYPDVRISVNIRATGEIVSDVLKDVAHIGIAYSPPTRWVVDIVSLRDDIDNLELEHQPVTLFIQQTSTPFSDSTYRPIHGFVHKFHTLGQDGNLTVYQVEFESALFFLGKASKNDPWFNKSARDILTELLFSRMKDGTSISSMRQSSMTTIRACRRS